MTKFATVDDYIDAQPEDVAQRLITIRQLFHDVVPETKESISYQIMAFTVGKHRLYISGYNNHIGMYPIYGMPELEKTVEPYRGKGTKDSLHFKHTEPLPLDLIRQIIIAKSRKG